MSWRVGAACVLVAALAQPGAASEIASETQDPELRRAIQLVEDGDYGGGLKALDASLRRLEGATGKSTDRALAHLYAGVALVARGLTSAGKERFRKALAEDPALTISPEQFPPKVTELFAAARTGGPREPAPRTPSLRLVRSTSGSGGAPRGTGFVIEDARTSFEIPADRQAVVYFEWEAPAGAYRLRGAWRDPKGAVALQPEIEATAAGGHLGAYWFLALPESVTPGQWTLEVSLEGRSIGQHAIQVLAKKTEHAAAEVPDDLYAAVAPSLVVIEKRDAEGKTFGQGLGFFIGTDLLATAFQVVEGARTLRLRLGDGRSVVVERVAAWNRWQDWALLEVPSAAQPALHMTQGPLPEKQKYRVIDLDGDGRPYLGRAVVVSQTKMPGKAGERLKLGVSGGTTEAGFRLLLPREAAGGPLLDGRGQVVGILGGSLTPGEASAEGRLALGASMAAPASLVTHPQGAPATLTELIARGESLEPSRRSELVRVVLAKRIQTVAGVSSAEEETTEFTRSDRSLAVWALWAPREKRKARLRTRIDDLDGGQLAEGETLPVQFEVGQSQTLTWHLDLSRLPEGVHRVDLLLESDVVWRGYFRLSE